MICGGYGQIRDHREGSGWGQGAPGLGLYDSNAESQLITPCTGNSRLLNSCRHIELLSVQCS